MNENTARPLQPNAPLGFQRREVMELAGELQAAVEKVAAILRQVNGKVADLRASVREEYRKDMAVNLRDFFDGELIHQLNGGDPPAGSFQAAMLADRPKRMTLADKVAASLEMIDDLAKQQRAASIQPVRACAPVQPTTEPGPLTDEPDELETDEETLWA